MPNNFRLTGDYYTNYYISKAGHDSNDGLTPDTPKKTIQYLGQGTYIVGAGMYSGSLNIGSLNLRYMVMLTDGTVIINNSSNFSVPFIDNGLIIKNSIVFFGGLTVYAYNYLDLINCTVSGIDGESKWNYCKIINTDIVSGSSTGPRYMDFCIVIGSNIVLYNNKDSSFTNSYIDIASTISFQAPPIVGTAQFGYNNIQGIIQLDGVRYAIQDQFTGTPQDNGYDSDVYWLNEANLTANGYSGTISGWDAMVATCINRDPDFNDVSKLDFTLKATSPHLGRAADGVSNIGGINYAQSYYVGTSNTNILLLESEAGAFDTTTNIYDWVLNNLVTQGYIRMILKVSDTPEELSIINYIGNLSFDSDEQGGTTAEGGTNRNFNVPDSRPITSEYPDYLTTTADAADDTTLVITNHGASIGEWVKVDGQYREITAIPDSDTIAVASSFRSTVTAGTDVQIGTFKQLAALNPNRLNFKMRTTTQTDINSSNWDNDTVWDNNGLVTAGKYLVQEWGEQPRIDNLNGVGIGDDEYDDAFGNTIQATYIDIIIYLRDDYKS